MRRSLAVISLVLLIGGALGFSSSPASAVGYLGGSGGIKANPDFSACGTANFASGTIVGAYSAVGVVVNGTTVYNINTVKSINQPGTSVQRCNGGAVMNPDFGLVVYTLEAQSTSGGGVTSVKVCTDSLTTPFVCVGDDGLS